METSLISPKTKVGLIFDDGFTKSCLRISDLFEARGQRATFAVLVNHADFMPDIQKGDFALWNELKERGHVIHPHGYDHTDLTKIPHGDAVAKIDACLESFSSNLTDFIPSSCIYHAAYNRTSPGLDAYLLTKVAAVRSTGPEGTTGTGMNGAKELGKRVLTCAWHGPGHCDEHLLASLRSAELVRPPLFLYMLHGLDDEGWGPIRTSALERALDFIHASTLLQYSDLKEL